MVGRAVRAGFGVREEAEEGGGAMPAARLTEHQKALAAAHAHIIQPAVRKACGGPRGWQDADDMSGLAAVECCRLAALWDPSKHPLGEPGFRLWLAGRLVAKARRTWLPAMRRKAAGFTARGTPSALGRPAPLEDAAGVAARTPGVHEEAARADAALALLPLPQRRAVVMRFLLDKPWGTIARKLRCPPASAEAICGEGIAMLRRAMEGEESPGGRS